MNIARLSVRYAVRPLADADVAQALALCRSNPLYFAHCPPAPTEDSLRADMQALPPGKRPEDKGYLGYFDGERLIALLDLILAYPDAQTAFIGFFMTDSAVQKQGVGSEIVKELCDFLRELGFSAVQLGWAQGNPQAERFWHKNGFVETGRIIDAGSYRVAVARRAL